jgi:hypothetical protein
MQRFDGKKASYTSYSDADTNGVTVYEAMMSLEEYQSFVNSREPRAILLVDGREITGLSTNQPGVPQNDGRFRVTFTAAT